MPDPALLAGSAPRFLRLLLVLIAAALLSAPVGAAECNDGIDNDGDWNTDFPNDPDCADPFQDDEVGPEPAYTAHFAAEPSGDVTELVVGTVKVTAQGSDVSVTNAPNELGGVGVVGGVYSDFIDPGELILFTFGRNRPRTARDVSYRIHAAPGVPLGSYPGEVEITLYDENGFQIGSVVHQGLGTRELNDVFGTSQVVSFGIRALAHPMRISGLVYTLNPQCSDGIDNDADGLVDFDGAGGGTPDPQCGGDPLAAENVPACGLGFEVVPLLLLWRRWRRRRA